MNLNKAQTPTLVFLRIRNVILTILIEYFRKMYTFSSVTSIPPAFYHVHPDLSTLLFRGWYYSTRVIGVFKKQMGHCGVIISTGPMDLAQAQSDWEFPTSLKPRTSARGPGAEPVSRLGGAASSQLWPSRVTRTQGLSKVRLPSLGSEGLLYGDLGG